MYSIFFRLINLGVLLSILQACGGTDITKREQIVNDENLARARSDIETAAIIPLNDFNLVHAEIPSVLIDAQQAPYAAPESVSCEVLAREVQALDGVIGPDLDTLDTREKPDRLERGTAAVGRAAIGAIRGVTESVVPYRRWIRKLSGAERYSNEVNAALGAGSARRSFLKGLGQASGCKSMAYVIVEEKHKPDSSAPTFDFPY